MAFASFTITQPFLGAPLQFLPALGSQELELLIDAYVTGSASKQDKLSEVTIDFFNNATVDLNTGALVRHYNVCMPFSSSPWAFDAFEQFPTEWESSDFMPSIYTSSPNSSSATLGDSGYGSVFTTPPPNRNTGRATGGRVAKKAKKETKRSAEIRLPGFSIMTKDGVDVTSTAGRGTKTKEQREHAHLMRIMKACEMCKKKKIRCDPSHRRSHDDLSRSSTSASTSTSISTSSTTNFSSSDYLDLSPAPLIPTSLWDSHNASRNTLQTLSNATDGLGLFPEDTSSSETSWQWYRAPSMPQPQQARLKQGSQEDSLQDSQLGNGLQTLLSYVGMDTDQCDLLSGGSLARSVRRCWKSLFQAQGSSFRSWLRVL